MRRAVTPTLDRDADDLEKSVPWAGLGLLDAFPALGARATAPTQVGAQEPMNALGDRLGEIAVLRSRQAALRAPRGSGLAPTRLSRSAVYLGMASGGYRVHVTRRPLVRLAAVMVMGMAFVVTPGPSATAHPGGTDSSGCHTCRTNCTETYGIPYGDYHCHGGGDSGGGGGSATTAPPPTDPPDTKPPPTSPPTTTGSGNPSTTAGSATTTTTEAAYQSPAEPVLFVKPATEPASPVTKIEIQGEPRARYRALVESEPHETTGQLSASGTAWIEVLVENGDHTLTVELEDADGNVSEAARTDFTVDLPPPARPRAGIVVGPDRPPLLVRVRGAPPVGRAIVTLDGDAEYTERLSSAGTATVEVDVRGGDHTLLVEVEDFQGQRSSAVRLETSSEDDGDSVPAGVFVAAVIAAGVGSTWVWRRRSRSRGVKT